MHEPLIHILMPTFEPRADFLRAALDSVLAQTEQQWKLSINDDASSTNVHTIVEPYLRDPRITFTRNPHRLGIGDNWNACLRNSLSPVPSPTAVGEGSNWVPPSPFAKGEGQGERVKVRGSTPYIQFLFQDDFWHPTYLEHTLSILETHPTVGFVAADHSYVCEKDLAVRPLYDHLQRERQRLLSPGPKHGQEFLQWWLERGLHPNLIGEPSFVMMRRNLVEHIGLFDENMPQFLDVEYWTRCLAQTDWYHLAENCGTFRVHTSGASEQNRQHGRGMADRLLCVEKALRLLPTNICPHRAHILSYTLDDMIGKFRKEHGHESAEKNPLRLLPLFPFFVRHPIITTRSLFRAFS